jgi:hypothetical protein
MLYSPACVLRLTMLRRYSDVTNEKALRGVHEKIFQTMPPIAGALNGAMVLRDSSIPNMDYDQLMDVIRPKVLGSIHLDRIFYNVHLDWFILVSSINCIIGNVGQANVSNPAILSRSFGVVLQSHEVLPQASLLTAKTLCFEPC